ncbi:MAG TPA: PilZ domain-containing protein [Anaeromyxobacteraceae bacterium]|nr:PilZ domain-containing protein [Anaeromyxobacteraceae bacterium]
MEEFIRNQRRVPRVPVRLRVTVSSAGGEFTAQTEDVGPAGCRLLCPCLVGSGDLLRLSIHHDAFPEPLRVAGKVVWRSARTRLRAGVRYHDESRVLAETWFKRLLERNPAVAARLNPVPTLLPFSARLHRATETVSAAVHTDEERALFAEIVEGRTVRELMGIDPALRRERASALFALLATGAVRIDAGEFQLRVPAPAASAATAAAARPRAAAAPPDGTPARPADAQRKFEEAQRLAREGNVSAAIPLLREALKLSPRDPAIAALLAQVAFGGGGRQPR